MLKEAYDELEVLCIFLDRPGSIKNIIHKVYKNAMHGPLAKKLQVISLGKGKNIAKNFNGLVKAYKKNDMSSI